MANRRRGEIEAELGGKTYTLCLTLGGLAELESAFVAKDLVELAERFSQGRLSADEAITIITLGLKGAGHIVDKEDVAMMPVDGGAAGAVRIVSELLAATFGADIENKNSFDAQASKEGEAPRP
jgi:hypothetical protein